MNKIVYSQLSVATADGTAHHLIKKFDDVKDGHKAWKALCEWYDGDAVKSENAEGIRVHLDNLKLHSGNTASEYINKFLTLSDELSKLNGKAYSKNHLNFLFLRNIEDTDYIVIKKMLKNDRNITLRDCINAIRKQERELMMERYEKRKRRFNNMRRKKDQRDEEDDIEPSTKIRKLCGTLETNEEGFLRLPVNEWKDLPNEDKRFIQRYNAKVKHNEDLFKLVVPDGVVIKSKVRRNKINEKNGDKKEKGITFNLEDILSEKND